MEKNDRIEKIKNIGICLLQSTSNGGSYQFWLAVLKALSELPRNRYRVTAFSENSDWETAARRMGVEYCRVNTVRSNLQSKIDSLYRRLIPKRFYRKLSALCFSYLRPIEERKLDFLLSQTAMGPGEFLNIPTMMPIFDLMHRYEKEFEEVSRRYEYREKLYRGECAEAAAILVDSSVGRQHVLESYGTVCMNLEKKVKILPFIAPDYIYEGREEKVDGLAFDRYIFYPAQFWTHKNHRNLILSLERLKKKGSCVNLVLVGTEQNNRKKIEQLIAERGLSRQVQILGYVSNRQMVYLYKHARAMVMPTFMGPTNIPQLEAFELGCPVATSAIYGIPEQVGDAALLFDPRKTEEIADCIYRLWEDDELCRELAEKGKKRSQAWGQSQFTERLFDYIEECVWET